MKAVASPPPNAAPSEVPAFPPIPAAFGARGPVRPGRGGFFRRLQVADARRRFGGLGVNPAILRAGLPMDLLKMADGAIRDGAC